MNKKISKKSILVFEAGLLFSILTPGILSTIIIYLYFWYFDFGLILYELKDAVKQDSIYAIVVIIVGLLFTFTLIFSRLFNLHRNLILYIDTKLDDEQIISLKKNLLSFIPHILLIVVLAWIILDLIICIIYIAVGQNVFFIVRNYFISTLVGTTITCIPAYFGLDTLIKHFVRNYFDEVDLQVHSDVRFIPVSVKIFTTFVLGGIIPILIIFVMSNDYRKLMQIMGYVDQGIDNKFAVASIMALIVGVTISFASALYFSMTVARPLKKLDQVLGDIDGGDLNVKLKADFTDEIGHISQSLNNMINRVRASVKLHEEFALIEKELDIAEKVQCSVLTQPEMYESFEGYTISVIYRPQNGRVGGDYFNIMNIGDSCISVFLADATGHGMQAALTTMQIDMMNRQSLHLVDPAERFKFLNEYYISEIKGTNLFTACCVNLYHDHITYSGAGHPEQFLIRNGGDPVHVEKGGRLIGAFPDYQYLSKNYPIESGDVMILFTDGAFEQYNESGEMFGEDTLKEMILRYTKSGLSNDLKILNKTIFQSIKEFTGSIGLDDDVTIISIRKD